MSVENVWPKINFKVTSVICFLVAKRNTTEISCFRVSKNTMSATEPRSADLFAYVFESFDIKMCVYV